MEDSDPDTLRDIEIKRLAGMATLAFKNASNEKLRIQTRESWFQKYTHTVQVLNQLLKDSKYKDYEKRLRIIEESSKTPGRNVRTKSRSN